MISIYNLMKINRYIKSHQLKFASILFANILNLRHLFVRFDPVMACNLRCKMCYFSNDEFRKQNGGIFSEAEVGRLAKYFFPKTLQLVIGCGAEPTLYKDFTGIVQKAKEYKIPNVGIASNGQLLTESHVQELIEYGLDELTISMHGVQKETFENLMVNASYDKFHEVLNTVCQSKKRNKSNYPKLRLNYTINPDNLEELAHFFEVFGKYDINIIQLRPMMDIGGVYHNRALSNFIEKYNLVITDMIKICQSKRIIILANLIDPKFTSPNYESAALDAVYRNISPMKVWRSDFDWKNETYRDYCKKNNWNKYLFNKIFTDKEQLIQNNEFGDSLRYDIK